MNIDRYNEDSFKIIVRKSKNITDVAKNLGLNPFCGNRNTIKKYIKLYNIDISHFKINCDNNGRINNLFRYRNLNEILVINSNFSTTNLKNRLYKEGIKERRCEKCGQDENWHGERISMILDHINGINDDLRIENLRILCPNCNATLSTHGGKNVVHKKKQKLKRLQKERNVMEISQLQRKVKRPEYEQLQNEINELGYVGTGRKYGVSDNAIRKWIKFYKKHNTLLSGYISEGYNL